MNISDRENRQRKTWVKRLIQLSLIFFVLGSLHVYKEDWHSRIAHRLSSAQSRELKLRNESSRLELELAQVAAYTRIANRAEKELGMTAMTYPADTLWIESTSREPNYRMAALYRLSLKR